MEPSYALALCIGCFSISSSDRVIPNDFPTRILAPRYYMGGCFTDTEDRLFRKPEEGVQHAEHAPPMQ